jgi:hypothetical protein
MCFSKLFKRERPPEQPPQEDPPSPPTPTEPSGLERPSPMGTIPQSAIKLYADEVSIKGNNLTLLKEITDTNSMDPLLDTGHTLIAKTNFDYDALVEGDIVAYHAGSGRYICHRIIKIEYDNQGRLYTLEGDNNNNPDPYLVRNAHIKFLIVGILYTFKD